MENNFFNSPAIQRNTPIKRLGLSRKRKSGGSTGRFNASIQPSSEKSPRLDVKSKEVTEPESDNNSTIEHLNYEKEVEVLKIKISEKEEKLKMLQSNSKNILELENLITLWKTGCKNAFLEFFQILRGKEHSVKARDVLTKLGIWETMVKYFEDDSDIALSLNYSQ